MSRVRIAHLLLNAWMFRKDRDFPADYASRARGDRANAGPRSVVSRHCRAKKPRLPPGEFGSLTCTLRAGRTVFLAAADLLVGKNGCMKVGGTSSDRSSGNFGLETDAAARGRDHPGSSTKLNFRRYIKKMP